MKPDAETRLRNQEGALQHTAPSSPPSGGGRRATTKPRPRAAARRKLPRLMTAKPKPCVQRYTWASGCACRRSSVDRMNTLHDRHRPAGDVESSTITTAAEPRACMKKHKVKGRLGQLLGRRARGAAHAFRAGRRRTRAARSSPAGSACLAWRCGSGDRPSCRTSAIAISSASAAAAPVPLPPPPTFVAEPLCV